MKKRLSLLFAIMILLFNFSAAYDVSIPEAEAYLLSDFNSGEILLSKNIDEVRAIASLSKLMTYYVVMEDIKSGKLSYDRQVVADSTAVNLGGSSYEIKEGDSVSVRELIYALLLASGNDAAYMLAIASSGTEEAFVERMNKTAAEMRLTNAKFYNATGLPVKGEGGLQNTMTTRELLTLAVRVIRDYPEVLSITKLKKFTKESAGKEIENTNPLIGSLEGIDGLKTGMTDRAGFCLVGTGIKKGVPGTSEDTRFIGIVMGTDGFDSRRDAALHLMKFAYDTYETRIFSADKAVGTLQFSNGFPERAEYFPAENKTYLLGIDSLVETKLNLKDNIVLPINPGHELGLIDYYVDGQLKFSIPAVVHEKIKSPSLFELAKRFYRQMFASLDAKLLGN